MALDDPMADDGTHDIYSEAQWGRTRTTTGIDANTDGQDSIRVWEQTEMRQVQAVPVSLSAFL